MSRRFCTLLRVASVSRLTIMMVALFLCGFDMGTARAEPAATYRQENVTLRLVVLPPAEDGDLNGALSIELDPGWKTYWIAPGPVGLAPKLDFAKSSDVGDVTSDFPVPGRFMEGDAQSIGYDEALAIPFRAEAEGSAPVVKLDVLLGVCRELCVPVQATLEAMPTTSLSDRALVNRAEASSPGGAGPLTPVSVVWDVGHDHLLIEVPPAFEAASVDAFASAGDGWSFGAPVRVHGANGERSNIVTLPLISRPAGTAVPKSADLLLTTGEIAQLSRAVPIASQ